MIIQTENLTKKFKSTGAVSLLNLTVEEGSIYGFLAAWNSHGAISYKKSLEARNKALLLHLKHCYTRLTLI